MPVEQWKKAGRGGGPGGVAPGGGPLGSTATPVPPPSQVVERQGGLEGLLGTGVRVGSGFAGSMGGPAGAAITGGGEALAQLIEQYGSIDDAIRAVPDVVLGLLENPGATARGFAQGATGPIARIGVEAGLGAIPGSAFTKGGDIIQSALRGGAIGGVGSAGRQLATSGEIDPRTTLEASALSAGLGGLLGRMTQKPVEKLPTQSYEVVTTAQPGGQVLDPTKGKGVVPTERVAPLVAPIDPNAPSITPPQGEYQDRGGAYARQEPVGPTPSYVKSQQDIAKAEEAAFSMQAKEQAALQKSEDEASRLAEIEQARADAGVVAQPPSFSESLSAPTPGGGRASMSTRFKAPDEEEGGGGFAELLTGGGRPQAQPTADNESLASVMFGKTSEPALFNAPRMAQPEVTQPQTLPESSAPSPFDDILTALSGGMTKHVERQKAYQADFTPSTPPSDLGEVMTLEGLLQGRPPRAKPTPKTESAQPTQPVQSGPTSIPEMEDQLQQAYLQADKATSPTRRVEGNQDDLAELFGIQMDKGRAADDIVQPPSKPNNVVEFEDDIDREISAYEASQPPYVWNPPNEIEIALQKNDEELQRVWQENSPFAEAQLGPLFEEQTRLSALLGSEPTEAAISRMPEGFASYKRPALPDPGDTPLPPGTHINRAQAESFERAAAKQAPPSTESEPAIARFFKSRVDAAGQGNRDIKAANAAGEAVPEPGRKAAGKALQREAAAAGLPTERKYNPGKGGFTAGAGLGGVNDIAGLLERNPGFAAQLGAGTVGAAAGAASNEEDPFYGALLGGAAGAGGVAGLQKYGKSLGEVGHSVMENIPKLQRFNYLADPPSLVTNTIVGPMGAAVTGGLEAGLSGDPRGWQLLKNSINPIDFVGDIRKNYAEGKQRITSGDIGRAEGLDYNQDNPFQKAMSFPPSMMAAGDITAQRRATSAGFSEDEAKAFTHLNEPEDPWLQKLAHLGRREHGQPQTPMGALMDTALPFKRTPTVLAESGAMRTPLGLILQHYRPGGPEGWRPQAVQQGLGAVGFGTGYYAGENMEPETAKTFGRVMTNAAGRYSLPVGAGLVAGQAAAREKDPYSAGAGRALDSLPLPTFDTVKDWSTYLAKGFDEGFSDIRPPSGTLPRTAREMIWPEEDNSGLPTIPSGPAAWRKTR